MKKTLLLLAFAASIYGYEGCGKDRNEALSNLSGNIKSRIGTSYQEEMKSNSSDDSVETKISSYIKASSNLTLVKIDYIDKKDKICAVVQHNDQEKNTKKLLKIALKYEQSNIPSDIDEKIKTLSKWIDDIEQLSFLMRAFLEDVSKEQEVLNKKEKTFKNSYE